jgi:hypothetical protein
MAPTLKLAQLNAALRGLTPGRAAAPVVADDQDVDRSEEHTSELQSLKDDL